MRIITHIVQRKEVLQNFWKSILAARAMLVRKKCKWPKTSIYCQKRLLCYSTNGLKFKNVLIKKHCRCYCYNKVLNFFSSSVFFSLVIYNLLTLNFYVKISFFPPIITESLPYDNILFWSFEVTLVSKSSQIDRVKFSDKFWPLLNFFWDIHIPSRNQSFMKVMLLKAELMQYAKCKPHIMGHLTIEYFVIQSTV